MYLTGVLQAVGVVILSAFFNIYLMFWTQNYSIHPTIFSLFCIISTSWTMLLISGPGRFANKTLFNFETWLQGFSTVANMILAVYLIQFVTGAEVAILRRLSVPLSIILALLIFNRYPKKSNLISFIVLLASCVAVIYLQNENSLTILFIVILAAFMQCSSFMLAETHKQSNQAHSSGDIRDRGRVVGMSTFITSSIFLAIIVTLSMLNDSFPQLNIIKFAPFTPLLSDFFGSASIISGCLFGLICSPFLRYFIWSANIKIKSENVLTILALIPLVTFIFQYIFHKLGVIEVNYNSYNDMHGILILLIIITMSAAAVFSSYLKTKENIKGVKGDTFWQKVKNSSKVNAENIAIGITEHNMADYEVVKNTIDFYEGDINKAAEMLELPVDTVKTLSLTKNTYALRDDISKKIHNIFRNKIFYLDQLTGVENKKGLIRQFASYQESGQSFNLYYMDINKFKQINDTLGHEIGDVAIITTVQRIKEYAEQNQGFAYRLGGDEFAMLTISEKSEEDVITELKEITYKTINYDKNGKVGSLKPSISIGKANILKESDVKISEIINSADENMYKDKKGK